MTDSILRSYYNVSTTTFVPFAFTAPYVGVLDTYPGASAGYSFRKLRSAYAGSAVRIRRNSDNAEQDFGFDGSGNVDTAAIATFLTATSGAVVTWYDQSGNGRDATQAVGTSQPPYLASAQNGHPACDYGGDDNLATASSFAAAAHTVFLAMKPEGVIAKRWLHLRDAGSTVFCLVGADTATDDTLCLLDSTDGSAVMNATSLGVGTPYMYTFSSTPKTYLNTADDTTAHVEAGFSAGTANVFNIGGRAGAGGTVIAQYYELIVYASVLSGGDRGGVEADINAYWDLF